MWSPRVGEAILEGDIAPTDEVVLSSVELSLTALIDLDLCGFEVDE